MSAPLLSTEQVMLLCDCFQRIDQDNDGTIDVSELDGFLQQTFPEAGSELLVNVRKVIIVDGDSNADGKIDIKEFIDLVSQRQYQAVLDAIDAQQPGGAGDTSTGAAPADAPPTAGDDGADPRIQSILANLEPREIDVLRDAFIKLDADGDGFLSRAELKRGLEERLRERFATSWQYLEKIFDVADRDEDDRLSIFEFLSSFADGPGVVPHDVVAECVENVKIRLTDEELETLRDRFYEIDKNGDNFIDRDELLAAMRDVLSSKFPTMTDAELEDIVATVIATADADKDGKLNLSEFIRSYQEDQGVLPTSFMGRAAAVKRRLTKEEVERLKEAFTELDDNADGFVDYGELYKAVTSTLSSSGLSDADAADLVDTIMLTADRNRDGKLSLSEFIRNFVQNEELMEVPVTAAEERRVATKKKIEDMVDSGDLYKMVKLFAFLDTNQDGFLQPEEVTNLLFRTLSEWYPSWTDDQKTTAIAIIVEGADVDGDGLISIDEFVKSYVDGYGILPLEVVREIGAHLRLRLSTDELQKVHDTFVELDKNGDGFVTNEELREALGAALGPVVPTPEQLDEITAFVMAKVDTNRDGKISLKEFITACEIDASTVADGGDATTGEPEEAERQGGNQLPAPSASGDSAPTQEADASAAVATPPKTDAVVTPTKGAAAQTDPQPQQPTGVIEAPAPPAKLPLPTTTGSATIVNDVSGALITDDQLREKFAAIDVSGNGTLGKDEFKQYYLNMEWCGLAPSDAEFEKMFDKLCGVDGEVSYEEYCLFMLHRSRL